MSAAIKNSFDRVAQGKFAPHGGYIPAVIGAGRITFLVAVLALVVSCSDKTKVSPPFLPDGRIVAHEELYIASEPSGMTGHQQIFGIWSLTGDEHTIVKETSDKVVRNKLYWLNGPSQRLNESLKWLDQYDTFKTSVYPKISNVLNAQDIRYAFEGLDTDNDGIEYESFWICSPSLRIIVYLRAY